MGDEVLDCMSDGSCGDETPGKVYLAWSRPQMCGGSLRLNTTALIWVHLHFKPWGTLAQVQQHVEHKGSVKQAQHIKIRLESCDSVTAKYWRNCHM